MRNNPRATDFVQQVQTAKHPVTGEELEVMIRQYFLSAPGVFYMRNGDPGEPPSCEPIGEPEILMADGSAAPDWVEDALINWDEFNEQDVQPIETTAYNSLFDRFDEDTDALGNNFSDADPGL